MKSGNSIAAIARRLSGNIVAAQVEMDRSFEAALRNYATDALGNWSGSDGPVADAVLLATMPTRSRLNEMNIETQLSIKSAKSAGAEVGLEILGRQVHTFLHARYKKSVSRTSRLSLHLEAIPQMSGERR